MTKEEKKLSEIDKKFTKMGLEFNRAQKKLDKKFTKTLSAVDRNMAKLERQREKLRQDFDNAHDKIRIKIDLLADKIAEVKTEPSDTEDQDSKPQYKTIADMEKEHPKHQHPLA